MLADDHTEKNKSAFTTTDNVESRMCLKLMFLGTDDTQLVHVQNKETGKKHCCIMHQFILYHHCTVRNVCCTVYNIIFRYM